MNRHSHTGTSFLLGLAALFLPLASFGGDGAGSCNRAYPVVTQTNYR